MESAHHTLKDGYIDLKIIAAEALGLSGAKAMLEPALQTLVAVLKREGVVRRSRAADVLVRLAEKFAVELGFIQVLVEALKDKYHLIRGAAAKALGKLGEKAVIEPVVGEFLYLCGCGKLK